MDASVTVVVVRQDSGHGELGEAAVAANKFGVWEVPAATFPAPVIDLAMGRAHCLFLLETGEVFSCGSNFHGQCGMPESIVDPGPEAEPIVVPTLQPDSADRSDPDVPSVAPESQGLDRHTIKAGDRLKCVTNALAQKCADMASERTCSLNKGARITALEVQQLEDGTERVRFYNGALFYGWVSRRSRVNAGMPSEWHDVLVSDDGAEESPESLRIEGADDAQVSVFWI